MSANSGYIVTFTDFSGMERKAIITHSKQSETLIQAKKFYVEFVNEDLTPQLEALTKKQRVGCVSASKIKIIGFID
jgi:hypothetical protein